jgi:hypothetical protein
MAKSSKKIQLENSRNILGEILRQKVSNNDTKVHIDNWDFDFSGKEWDVDGYTVWLNITFHSDGLPYEICEELNRIYDVTIKTFEAIQIGVDGNVVSKTKNPHSDQVKVGAFIGNLKFSIDEEEVNVELSLFLTYDL